MSTQQTVLTLYRIDGLTAGISIEKDDYKKELFSLYKDNIIDQYYGLKIQYLYPFISGKDFTYIPSPYLVVNAHQSLWPQRQLSSHPQPCGAGAHPSFP